MQMRKFFSRFPSENILIILDFNTKGNLCYINVLLLLPPLLKTYQQFVATTITTNKKPDYFFQQMGGKVEKN